MRPVTRGPSPQGEDFADYRVAFAELVSRLGLYCSYCERRIATQLAVEHIQPKAIHADLKGRWENFLLGCVNCNSTKGDQDVQLTKVLLPDRDNTFVAYVYSEDGQIAVQPRLTSKQRAMAERTLALTGLDKAALSSRDANGRFVALDRVRQRTEAWATAVQSRRNLDTLRNAPAARHLVGDIALAIGFFSVWMAVFKDDPAMRQQLIERLTGTATECFDEETTEPVSPRPNTDLPAGSKV